jgi:hypothetical protein
MPIPPMTGMMVLTTLDAVEMVLNCVSCDQLAILDPWHACRSLSTAQHRPSALLESLDRNHRLAIHLTPPARLIDKGSLLIFSCFNNVDFKGPNVASENAAPVEKNKIIEKAIKRCRIGMSTTCCLTCVRGVKGPSSSCGPYAVGSDIGSLDLPSPGTRSSGEGV